MCSCLRVFRSDYNTMCCLDCGRERNAPLSITQRSKPQDMTPFPYGYSRFKRFSKILDAVLCPTPSCGDTLMLQHLYGHRFDTMVELIGFMKESQIRDKRYTSLHFFNRLCVREYIFPPPFNVYEATRVLQRAFQEVEFAHLRTCPGETFFNYNWLLVVLLREHDFGFLTRYVKNLRCPNRKKFYTDLLIRVRRGGKPATVSVHASKIRKPTSVQRDDLFVHHALSPTVSANCGALLRKYIQDRTGENQCGSLG